MPATRVIIATYPIEQQADGVPVDVRLLHAGENKYDDDGVILFDADAASEVIRRYTKRGIDLMADYEHQSLWRPPVEAPASASKWEPEIRGGELWATNVAWTDKARNYLKAKEYRYFSIACRVDAKTHRCVELINFALTNTPAAHSIPALVAATRSLAVEDDEPPLQEKQMKTVIVALGMSADTEEPAAVARASRLADLERDVLELTQKSSLGEAIGALRANRAAQEQVVALTKEVAALKGERRIAEFDQLVRDGEAARKLTPGQVKGEWIAGLRAREDGVQQLKGYLADAVPFVDAPGAVTETPAVTTAEVLTPEDVALARKWVGDDKALLEKRLEGLRALKASLQKAPGLLAGAER